jgi:hypothetical protein
VVECLRGKKIIHVAVGALHCLAVTETGQVYAWGDNDHGQQVSFYIFVFQHFDFSRLKLNFSREIFVGLKCVSLNSFLK